MAEIANKINHAASEKNYSMMTIILFWCGLVVVSSLYITIPLVSIFSHTFNVSSAQATWVSSSFSFCYAIGFLFFGALSEQYGRKQIILTGLISLTIITPIIGAFDNLNFVITLRGIQGIAAATFAPSVLAYVAEMFPIEKRVTTIGFISSGFLMAGIVGQVISSLVSQSFGWNYVFYLLGAIYLVTTLLVIFFIPRSAVTENKGNILAPFKTMGKVITQKSLVLCYIITIMLLLSFVGMYTALGNYLSSSEFGLDSQDILYVRSVGIFGMLLAPFAGRLVAKFSVKKVLHGGLALAVIGLSLLGFSSNLIFLIIMSVVFVAGIAISVPTLISLVGQLGGAARGVAVSLYMFILFIGATIGPVISVNLLKTGSYTLTFEVLAMLLGIGLIVSFLIKKESAE
ncbi:MFS transporter [Priestia aryabhattai]|uniref:MFS transporter n=1 Tax=Priestia megaterium TaxID=1404 RepID=UPI0039B9A758